MSVVKGNFLQKNEAKRPVPLGGGQRRGGGSQGGKQPKMGGRGRPPEYWESKFRKRKECGKGGQKPIIQLAVMPKGGGPPKGGHKRK